MMVEIVPVTDGSDNETSTKVPMRELPFPGDMLVLGGKLSVRVIRRTFYAPAPTQDGAADARLYVRLEEGA
jgi:hypothetical protein